MEEFVPPHINTDAEMLQFDCQFVVNPRKTDSGLTVACIAVDGTIEFYPNYTEEYSKTFGRIIQSVTGVNDSWKEEIRSIINEMLGKDLMNCYSIKFEPRSIMKDHDNCIEILHAAMSEFIGYLRDGKEKE
jgi:hypothetical protein